MEKTVLFNPHFSEFFTNESRYCILFGGAGSGKSHAVAQKIVERCTRPNEKHKFLVVRKFRTTLEGSVFTLIRSIISDFGIYQHVSINNTKMSFTFSNGNEIIVTGLDDPEKIKSIHGITGIWCEEITELEEDDFQQLDLRLRGVTDSYMQICMSFNPISIDHWIYKMFFENEVPDTFKLWSNYKHNLFLDDAYINVLESRFDYDQNMKRIYVLGEWGKIKTNEEFYCMFDKERNVNTVVYNPELPIHMSFDFNVNPYFPVSLWQIQDIDGVFRVGCFKLYALENPYNNTEAACEAFIIPEQYAENWQRFCGGLAKPETFFTPRFSRAGAKRFGIPWEVFRPIQVEFLARGLAVQEPSSNGSGPVKLRAIGRAICKAFATTPPPQF